MGGPSRQHNPLHFGISVGIDRYPGFPGFDLGSAVADATAFRDWLIADDGGGLPPANVALVSATPDQTWPSPFDARPHVREINRTLHTFNARIRDHLGAHPGDWAATRIYVYAAGHGVGPPRGECGVLMADADPDLLGNYIDVSKYRDWYLACGLVHEVAIFADCCREIVRGVPPANEVPFTACSTTSPKGTAAFTAYATRLGDKAWEGRDAADRDRARGYFTRALLDGLRGGAADPSSGAVTSPALGEYVDTALAEMTRGSPFAQDAEPHHRPEAVIIRSGHGDEHGPWQPSDGDWELDLPDGFYEAVVVDARPDDHRSWLFKIVAADVVVSI